MNPAESDIVLNSNGYKYRFRWDWAQWPAEMKGTAACGVAMREGDDSRIYVLTRSPGWPIVVFDSTGKYIRHFGSEFFFQAPGSRPHGISVARDGSIWCCDDGTHKVFHFSPEGELLSTLGSGSPSDSGYDPAVPWPSDLKTIRRAAPPFNRPTKVIEAGSGKLFATDGYGNASVHRFSADGRLEKTWGGAGDSPGSFLLPHGLCFDPRGRLWVADRENYRLQVFSQDGAFIMEIPDPLYPSELWCDGLHMFVADIEGGVAIHDMEGNRIAFLGYPGGFLSPHGIAGDSRGNLFLAMIRGSLPLAMLERL